MIELAGLAGILGVAAAVALSLCMAIGRPVLELFVRRAGLRRRRRALELALAAPLLALVLVPLLCLLPSLVAVAAPAMDHCLHHDDHAVHLCFVHVPTVPLTLSGLGLGLLALVSARVGTTALRHGLRSRQLQRRIAGIRDAHDGDRVIQLSSDRWVAFTLGIIRPRVYVSTKLLDRLTARQRSVVLAHERGHQARRDPLRRLLLQAAAALHLPPVRRRLLALHELAVEQTCDALAAERSNGDRLLVAETLLSLERLASKAPAGAMGASHTQLEARVMALLEAPTERDEPLRWGVPALAMAALLAIASPAHHVAEHLLGHWLF